MAASCAEYALATVPLGIDEVETTRGAATATDNDAVVFCPPASANCTVNVEVPVVVGVPLSTPAADRLTPAGSVPADNDQVYGAVPPEPASVAE